MKAQNLKEAYGANTRDEDFRRYRNFSNNLSNTIKLKKYHYETQLCSKYTRQVLSSTITLPRIRRSDEIITTTDEETPEILVAQFKSTFAQEPDGPIPDIASPRTNQSIGTIEFTEADVLHTF